MKQLIDQSVGDAYFQGLKEGGVSAAEMDEQDAQNISDLIATQFEYVKAFADDARKARGDADKQNAVIGRIDLWAASIAAAGQAGLNSARGNEMVSWRLGPTSQHCRDCAKLNGQRHRRKWFADRNYLPATPGSATECGGWRCQCFLEA